MATETASSAADKKQRKSSSYPGVFNINDLQTEGTKIELAPETRTTGWKLNKSPTTVEDPACLKVMLTTPPVKKIDLVFPLGMEVSVRNLKGVTIKDALDAIHKVYKKKADDELEDPYLLGFEWDPEESWTSLKVHQGKNATSAMSTGGGKKKNKKNKEEDGE